MRFLFSRSAILMLALITMGCQASRPGQAEGSCSTRGVLKDQRNLAGCQFLIVTDDGRKLLPISWPDESFTPTDGLVIFFDYEPADEMASICMAEDEIVRITCLDQEIPIATDCVDVDQVDQTVFLQKAIERHQAREILKYRYRTDGWMYLLRGEKDYLYDCQGTLICQRESPSDKPCEDLAEPGARGIVIWQRP